MRSVLLAQNTHGNWLERLCKTGCNMKAKKWQPVSFKNNSFVSYNCFTQWQPCGIIIVYYSIAVFIGSTLIASS